MTSDEKSVLDYASGPTAGGTRWADRAAGFGLGSALMLTLALIAGFQLWAASELQVWQWQWSVFDAVTVVCGLACAALVAASPTVAHRFDRTLGIVVALAWPLPVVAVVLFLIWASG